MEDKQIAQPVAWIIETEHVKALTWSKSYADDELENGAQVIPLYAAPIQPASGAPAVPEAQQQWIIMGYGETDYPEFKVATTKEQAFEAVVGMMFDPPSEMPPDERDAWQKNFDEPDNWCLNETRWEAKFEIGGIEVTNIGDAAPSSPAAPVAQQPAQGEIQPLPEPAIKNHGPVSGFTEWFTADQMREVQREAYELGLSRVQHAAPDVDAMVNRFLGWQLPGTFQPDCYIHFDRECATRWGWPIGTNLLTAVEAKAMFEYCLTAPSSPAAPDAEQFYLASFKRPDNGFVTWWGPKNAGYTPYLDQAGIYTKDELIAGYHDSEYTVPVPVSFVRPFEMRVVDVGMSVCGKNFWSADRLRAAIDAALRETADKEGEKG